MTQILFVAGIGGPALEYGLPKLARRGQVHALPLAELSSVQRDEITRHATFVQWGPSSAQGDAEAVELIVRAAETVGADAVVTFSEPAVVAVAEACQRLGLRGPGPNVRRARDKALMRQVWRDAGVPVPRFVPVRSGADLEVAGRELERPFLLKSAWSSGSIGQVLVQADDDLRAVWSRVQDFITRAVQEGEGDHAEPDGMRQFVAEEIIRSSVEGWYDQPGYGDYLSVEGIVAGGRYHPICVTGRLPTIEPFTELSNQAPCVLAEPKQRILEHWARRAVDALGLDTCGTHTELKLLPDGTVCLLESAARLPGAMVTREVEEVYGIDLIDLLVGELLGENGEAAYPERMLVATDRPVAAATVALIATDSAGRPWRHHPPFDPERVAWGHLVSPGTRVEVVRGATVPPGTPMPRYDVAAGVMNFAGLLFLTAADPSTLQADTYSIIDGLEHALGGTR